MEKNLTARELFEALLKGETIIEKESDNIFKTEWRLEGEHILSTARTGNGRLLDIPLTNLMIKPRTININGFEVPEPCRKPLNKGTVYYYFEPFIPKDNVDSLLWVDDDIDRKLLGLGIIHLTKENAIQHIKALLSFTEVK